MLYKRAVGKLHEHICARDVGITRTLKENNASFFCCSGVYTMQLSVSKYSTNEENSIIFLEVFVLVGSSAHVQDRCEYATVIYFFFRKHTAPSVFGEKRDTYFFYFYFFIYILGMPYNSQFDTANIVKFHGQK